MKKNDNFVATNATNEEHMVILNGIEMKRDEHGDYKKIDRTSKSISLSIVASCLAIASGFLLIASAFSRQTNPNLATSRKASTTESISWDSNAHHAESSTTEANAQEDTGSKTYTLTIRYVGPSGEELYPATQREMKAGDAYSIVSPSIQGYTPCPSTTSGIMDGENQSRDVEYDKNQD